MRIVLTGGGTGGHVMPFEPIIESLRTTFLKRQSSFTKDTEPADLELYFVGVVDGHTQDFFSSYNVPTIHIPSGKMRRYASVLTIVDLLFRLPLGIFLALINIFILMPDAVVSKGGYGSVPTVLAALFYRIPVLLHESDTVPGATNTMLMPMASIITLGFKETLQYIKKWEFKAIVTGTPIRSNIQTISQAEAKKTFGIPAEEKVLLVIGGSQGAKQINEAILQMLPKLIIDTAIIHVTGEAQMNAINTVANELLGQSARKHLYKIYPYLTDTMVHALNAADAVVTRAGASSLAEIVRVRKPMLIIPLDSSAGDHQRKNAEALEAAGAALVLDPINLGRNLIEQNVRRIISDEPLRGKLIDNMAHIDHPEAAQAIADLTFKLISGLEPEKT